MNLNFKYCSFVVFFSLFFFSFIGCDHSRKKPGYDYFPDMVYSKAYETYKSNPNFADGKTVQNPVEGTISREMIPYQYPKTDEGMKKAGLELTIPSNLKDVSPDRGKREYDIYCAICHGLDGRGEGILYKSGKYPSEPASLVSPEMAEKPDGEIYHVITVGSAIMQAHASQIKVEDRWKIILYIKNVLQKNNKKMLDSLAKEESNALELTKSKK